MVGGCWSQTQNKNRGGAEDADGDEDAVDGIHHGVVNDAEDGAEGVVAGETTTGSRNARNDATERRRTHAAAQRRNETTTGVTAEARRAQRTVQGGWW